mmetsp:Transcript_48084/g.121358  ORF Transcript_48084/g.121358 Transcript_48084/m.121358 type:complete len:307 (+) Transcript_48084:983-1903(+)
MLRFAVLDPVNFSSVQLMGMSVSTSLPRSRNSSMVDTRLGICSATPLSAASSTEIDMLSARGSDWKLCFSTSSASFVRDWLQIMSVVRLLLGTSTGSPESRRNTVEQSLSPSTTPIMTVFPLASRSSTRSPTRKGTVRNRLTPDSTEEIRDCAPMPTARPDTLPTASMYLRTSTPQTSRMFRAAATQITKVATVLSGLSIFIHPVNFSAMEVCRCRMRSTARSLVSVENTVAMMIAKIAPARRNTHSSNCRRDVKQSASFPPNQLTLSPFTYMASSMKVPHLYTANRMTSGMNRCLMRLRPKAMER